MGHKVFVVCSCISDSKEGYEKSLYLWDKFSNKEIPKKKFINRFVFNNLYISLVKTRSWQRNLLNSDEEENIYKEAINLMNLLEMDFLIGWGNLLLEESIFKEATRKRIKICFYLVNPTYKGKKTYMLDNADLVLTDSKATRDLYKSDLNCEIHILSKSLEKIPSHNSLNILSKVPKNCLLVNPSLEKGLEPFLDLSEYFYQQKSDISFLCIDGRNQFKKDLRYLNLDESDIKNKIFKLPAVDDINNLFSNIRILLLLSIWHESGSRLILEAYCRGIPVIAFHTGGNSELMKKYPDDIFKKPDVYFDKNNQLRITNWDVTKISERIKRLNEDDEYYNFYSTKIRNENKFEEIHNKFIISLEKMIEKLIY